MSRAKPALLENFGGHTCGDSFAGAALGRAGGWDDGAQKLSLDGATAWTEPDSQVVEIVKR